MTHTEFYFMLQNIGFFILLALGGLFIIVFVLAVIVNLIKDKFDSYQVKKIEKEFNNNVDISSR